MILSDTAIRNRVTILVMVVLIVAMGLYSYVTLPRESAPDVKVPYIVVDTSYEGVSPEDIETQITNEIEKELLGLRGVKEIRSTSLEGLSSILVEFHPDVDINDALRWVKDKVDLAKPDLPNDVQRKEPTVSEINIAEFPIMMLNISGDVSPVVLKGIADALEDAIKAVPGVLDVEVLGALEREIRIEIDPDRLAAYSLTVDEILRLIPTENVNVSAGGLETEGMKFHVRVPAEFKEPEKINNLKVATRDGKPIYLSDIAQVRDLFKDRASYARMDGVESITVSVKKRVGANIVDIARGVKAILAEARRQAPATVKFELTLDRSKDIDLMVRDLENNILSGLILVVTVLVLFMGWRSSMIVALAIPLSMLMSFAVLQALGYTLNMIVLFSLILALGMLVDNAIVIVENIYRHVEMGYGRVEAAMKGTAEVAWPVIASTATTVAAFVPLMFWPGIMGDFMKYLPITVSITLTSSMLVALLINPVVASMFSGGSKRKGPAHQGWFATRYRAVLDAALAHRFTTVAVAGLTLVCILIAFGKFHSGVELFPDSDPKHGMVNLRGPQGMNIRDMNVLAKQVAAAVDPFRTDPTGETLIDNVVENVGTSGSAMNFGDNPSGPHIANLTIAFVDFDQRKTPSAETVQSIRAALRDVPGVEVKVEKEKHGPPTGAAVTVRFIGEDMRTLERVSEKARKLIEDVPNLVNLRSDLEAARPELRFEVDRERAKQLGVNTQIVGNFLKTSIFGSKVGTFRVFADDYDITIRLPEDRRTNIEDLLRLRVPNSAGAAVPLSSLGRFVYAPGLGTIHRIDQKRVVTLTADAEGRLGTEVLQDVQERLRPEGQASLRAVDVRDFPAFCLALEAGARPEASAAAKRVWDLLRPPRLFGLLGRNESVAETVRQVARTGKADNGEQREILGAINRVLARTDFYRAEDFRDAPLDDELKRDLARGIPSLSQTERVRANRLLLEAAFPGQIVHRDRMELPADCQIRYAGEKEEQDKAQAFLLKAFVVAILLIVGILVTQFNTLSVPLIIMTTVILSTIGVFTELLALRMPFVIIMTGVGIISLAGVVVNNAIVLLDYTRRLQRKGMDLLEAARTAGMTRLRPVLLTAATTIISLVPMATGVSFDFRTMSWALRSESSQWWASMAWAVIFGLAFATVLTLVVVPSLYVSLYRLAAKWGLGGLTHAGDELKTQPVEMEDF